MSKTKKSKKVVKEEPLTEKLFVERLVSEEGFRFRRTNPYWAKGCGKTYLLNIGKTKVWVSMGLEEDPPDVYAPDIYVRIRPRRGHSDLYFDKYLSRSNLRLAFDNLRNILRIVEELVDASQYYGELTLDFEKAVSFDNYNGFIDPPLYELFI